MNNRLMFRPNLVDCILEERVAPAIANLATIILTNNGLTLIEAFPGSQQFRGRLAGCQQLGRWKCRLGQWCRSFRRPFISRAARHFEPEAGNITGVPSLAGGATGAGGCRLSIQVGSGADTGGGPTNRSQTAERPTILSAGHGCRSHARAHDDRDRRDRRAARPSSPVLPPGQTYHDTAPVAGRTWPVDTYPNRRPAGPA